MTRQLDMFASATPTFPPHLDPAKVDEVWLETGVDRDHVGAAAIGRVGNNKGTVILKVSGRDGSILHSEQFDTWERADEVRETILRKLKDNQQSLFQL